jgi:hypothetical protein
LCVEDLLDVCVEVLADLPRWKSMTRDEDLAQWPLPLGSDEELMQTCSVEQLVELLASEACLVSYDTDPAPDLYGGPADIVHYAPAVARRVLALIGAPARIAAHARTKDADISQAIIALVPFADHTSLRDLERVVEPKVRAALVPIGDLDALIRSRALPICRSRARPLVIPALVALLSHTDGDARAGAARALAIRAAKEALPPLRAALEREHDDFGWRSIHAAISTLER